MRRAGGGGEGIVHRFEQRERASGEARGAVCGEIHTWRWDGEIKQKLANMAITD